MISSQQILFSSSSANKNELVWPCLSHTDWILPYVGCHLIEFLETETKDQRQRRATECRLWYLYERMRPFLCYLITSKHPTPAINSCWTVLMLRGHQEKGVWRLKIETIKKFPPELYECSMSNKVKYISHMILYPLLFTQYLVELHEIQCMLNSYCQLAKYYFHIVAN